MMNLAKRILAFSLSLVIFVSSGGVVLAVHYCSKNTTKDVSFFSNKTCCKKNFSCERAPSPKLIKKKCCDLKVTLHKVDISTFLSEKQQIDLPGSSFDLLLDPAMHTKFVVESFVLSNKAPPFFIGGKSFLNISQQYLI